MGRLLQTPRGVRVRRTAHPLRRIPTGAVAACECCRCRRDVVSDVHHTDTHAHIPTRTCAHALTACCHRAAAVVARCRCLGRCLSSLAVHALLQVVVVAVSYVMTLTLPPFAVPSDLDGGVSELAREVEQRQRSRWIWARLRRRSHLQSQCVAPCCRRLPRCCRGLFAL